MADRVIDLLIKLKDETSPELKEVGKAFVQTAGVMGAAVAKFAWDAAPLEGVQQAFKGIAESSGVSAEAMLDALEEGSAGMVRQRDLLMTYNQAAQLVSTTFANQLPEAMTYLRKVSLATGEDMGYMLDSLVRGVGRLSPAILDNLQVQVTLADATARAAEMYGVQADALNKSQIQAGMMNVVLEKLQSNTAAMPDVVGTAAQQTAAFGARMGDLKDKVGLMALPALSSVLGVVNDLNDSTLVMVAGLGSAATAMVKFSGGLGPLAEKLSTTQGGLVMATAAVGAWVVAWEQWQDLQSEITKGLEASRAALDGWASEAEGMLASGENLTVVVDTLAARVNEADEAFHKDSWALADLGTAYARATGEAQVMGDAAQEVRQVILSQADSLDEANSMIARYNASISSEKATLFELSKTQWEAARAQMGLTEATEEASVSLEEATVLAEMFAAAAGEDVASIDALADAERQLTFEKQMSAATSWQQVQAAEASDQAMLGYVSAVNQGVVVTDELRLSYLRNQAAAEEQAAKQAYVAEVTARQKERLKELAEANRIAAEAAAEHASSTAQLAMDMKNATSAEIANKFVGMLDPKAMGAENFTNAVNEIGIKFGLMDERSIALSTSMGTLAEKVNANVVPAEDVSEALDALITDAEDGEVSMDDLIDTFGRSPDKIRPVSEAFERTGQGLGMINANAAGANAVIGDIGGSAEVAAGPMDSFAGSVIATEENLRALVAGSPYSITVNADEGDGGGESDEDDGYNPNSVPSGFGGFSLPVGGGTYSGVTVVVQGPLVGEAVVRDEADLEALADLVAERLGERVALRRAGG